MLLKGQAYDILRKARAYVLALLPYFFWPLFEQARILSNGHHDIAGNALIHASRLYNEGTRNFSVYILTHAAITFLLASNVELPCIYHLLQYNVQHVVTASNAYVVSKFVCVALLLFFALLYCHVCLFGIVR